MTVERVLAPNPGFYTGPGTNTYLVSNRGDVAILDPGPVIERHRNAIVEAIGGRTPVAVIVTHTHPDHAPLANPLAAQFDVPVYGYGPGPGFEPSIRLGDGDTVGIGGLVMEAVHTPGHTSDHLCFRLGERLFTGDHIMGGSTVIMEDAREYLESLHRILRLGVARIEPGHGPSMGDADAVIGRYIEHRLAREAEILDVVRAGPVTVEGIVDAVYSFVPPELRAAATHQVIVQLNKLYADGEVRFPTGAVGPSVMVETNAR
jgi:glyoxylase-like metal-dependent hydrolase (beta-lactamase superfamily II)